MLQKSLHTLLLIMFVICSCGSNNNSDRTYKDGEDKQTTAEPSDPQNISGIWSSRAELALLPMSGDAWETVYADAKKDTSNPDVGNQNDNTNCFVLAAAIVSERLMAAEKINEAQMFREKVISAIEKIVADGQPEGSRTLAWGREIGAYAMAADLIGYRTSSFEKYLQDATDKWICSARKQTLHEMTLERPNNWGSMGFGTMCAIYAYLGNISALSTLRDTWLTTIIGPSAPSFKYGDDLSWHVDPSRPMIINPAGTTRDGLNLDGLQPEEMRRGSSFRSKDITGTGYPFEALQGWIMAARILERQGMPIWEEGNKALYRAVYSLEIYLTQKEGSAWSFSGDDLWMLALVDKAYGSNFSKGKNVWGHGKNAGYPYVAL